MENNIKFRPVRPDDAEKYLKLTNLVWRDAYKHIFPEEVFVEKEAKTPNMIKTFSDFVYNGRDQIVYVAECEGEIVGFVSGKLTTNYEHFKPLGYAELLAIYIHPKFQGIGIGTKFKNMFIKWAKEKEVKKFVIGVLKDNHKARKVYEKWGGILDSYTEPFIRLGVGYEEVFYCYEL